MECVDYTGNSVSQLTSRCCLKLAIMRVFIPWKLANATNHSFFFLLFFSGKLVVKQLSAYHQLYILLEIKKQRIFLKIQLLNHLKMIINLFCIHINTCFGKTFFLKYQREEWHYFFTFEQISFNVQHNGRQLDSHICSCFRSVAICCFG